MSRRSPLQTFVGQENALSRLANVFSSLPVDTSVTIWPKNQRYGDFVSEMVPAEGFSSSAPKALENMYLHK